MVKLTEHAELSRETVRRRLAENDLKPWRQDMWCIPEVDGTYVARMEDVLDLYAEPPDPKRPVVCFDESPTQLIGEVRQPIPATPGQLERYDCEYRRNGTANLFVFLDAHQPWRTVKVTDQPHRPRLRRMHARSRRPALSQGRADPRRARQPVDPFAGRPLRGLPGPRGAPHPAPVWSCVDAPVDARDLLTAPAMIGCGHVSGLEVRLCHMPRAGMEIRRPGADQKSER